MPNSRNFLVKTVRIVFGAAIFAAGWYLTLGLRTTHIGEDARSLIVYVITGLPLFLLAVPVFVYRNNPGKTLAHSLIFTTAILLSVMFWAAAEEQMAVHILTSTCETRQPMGCDDLTEDGTLVYRRWPFENHTISFSTQYGWQGSD